MNILVETLTPKLLQNSFSSYLESDRAECPVCQYLLRGLPAIHRCPECGFEYDIKTQIWTESVRYAMSRSQPWLVLILLLACLMAAIPSRGWMDPKSWAVAVAAILLGSVMVKRLFSGTRRRFLIVGSRGLIFRVNHRVERISWPEVDDMHMEQRLGTALLCLDGQGERRHVNLSCLFSDRLQARLCETELLRAMAEFDSAPNEREQRLIEPPHE